MADAKPKSVLIGFGVCPLCAGKTHVKRIDAPGKRPYSHCLDEHDKGCSHTHYATNAQQDGLMRGLMRPIKPLEPSATPSAAPAPAATQEPAPTPTPPSATAPKPKRRGLFDI